MYLINKFAGSVTFQKLGNKYKEIKLKIFIIYDIIVIKCAMVILKASTKPKPFRSCTCKLINIEVWETIPIN